VSFYDAHRAETNGDLEERQLSNLIAEMAIAAGVPPPRVMVLDDDLINAAVVGRSICCCRWWPACDSCCETSWPRRSLRSGAMWPSRSPHDQENPSWMNPRGRC
jgi:hypothetical protein